MAHSAKISRKTLTSRSVLALFGLQIAFLIATFTAPIHGIQLVTVPVTIETQFLNRFTDLLFEPGYNGLWDPLATLLLLPAVYYATAVVLTALGRGTYRLGQR